MSKKEQKFHHGDLVRVAKDLGRSMSHFPSDVDAIVIGSYDNKYGGGNTDSYTLHIKDHGQVSWYYEAQLALVETGRADLLKLWEQEKEDLKAKQSNLDWIFENGPEVSAKGYGPSVEALARCLGIENLWGSRGEGFVYLQNGLAVLGAARPYLDAKDKPGYLAMCSEACGDDQDAARP